LVALSPLPCPSLRPALLTAALPLSPLLAAPRRSPPPPPRRLQIRLHRFESSFARRLPILRAVVRLRTRYGASMAVYFSFCAWLQIGAMLQV
jgi:hypothetical protein